MSAGGDDAVIRQERADDCAEPNLFEVGLGDRNEYCTSPDQTHTGPTGRRESLPKKGRSNKRHEDNAEFVDWCDL